MKKNRPKGLFLLDKAYFFCFTTYSMNLNCLHNTGKLVFANDLVEPVLYFPVCDALI